MAPALVGGADLDLVQAGEHVELGHGDVGESAQAHGVAQDDQIQPAAAAAAAGGGPELLAFALEVVAVGVIQFGDEGSAAHAGGVGLDDAHHAVQGAGAGARARGRVGRRGVGGGHEGVCAVVDVELHALGALEEYAAAIAGGLAHQAGDVVQERRQAGGDGGQVRDHLLGVHGFFAVQAGQQSVFLLESLVDLGADEVHVLEIAGAQPHAGGLVLVAGPDAPAGGADLGLVGEGVLAGGVQALVVVQDEVGAAADAHALGGCMHAAGGQGVHLAQEDGRVQDHAVADGANGCLVQDAGRDEVQDDLFAVHHQGVPGVVPALEADHQGSPAGQHVHDLAFALVAPLGADDDDVLHGSLAFLGHRARKGARQRRACLQGGRVGRPAPAAT